MIIELNAHCDRLKIPLYYYFKPWVMLNLLTTFSNDMDGGFNSNKK